MRLYIIPTGRALAVMALNYYLGLDCEIQPIDLGRGDQLTSKYVSLNPNKKCRLSKTMVSCFGSQTPSCLPGGQASRPRPVAVRY
jgi:hypothetical protein